MNVLIFTHGQPKYMPPIILHPDETVCGPRYNNLRSNGRYRYLHTPGGAFDSQEILGKIRPEDSPQLILVHADSTNSCLPMNLAGNCLKVLLIGDTHHLSDPIQTMLRYAASESFDAIILWNRQHAHFFTELGFTNVFWMPGLLFAVPRIPPASSRNDEICFFGQVGKHHLHRTRIIKSLVDAKVEVKGGTLTRKDALKLVSRSQASLNISLNGEFNLRVFESTQNEALLYTDALTHFTGLSTFFKDGESVVTYSDASDLISKISHYSQDREGAAKIAARGREITNRFFSFQARQHTFLALLNNEDAPDVFRLKDEPRCKIQAPSPENKNATKRRVQIYEHVQELHRTVEHPRVSISGSVTPFIVSDLADLVRLKQSVALNENNQSSKSISLLNSLGVKNAAVCDNSQLITEPADLLITCQKDVPRLMPALQGTHSSICIWDSISNDEPAQQYMADAGYQLSHDTPGLYRLQN